MSRKTSPGEDSKYCFSKNEIEYLNKNFYQLAGSKKNR